MKNLSLKVIVILIIGIILFQNNIVIAADATSQYWKEQESQNSQQIEETEKELEGIQQEKSETMKQVEELSIQITKYQNQIDELDSKISDLNTQIEEAQNKINESQANYEKQEKLMEARLIAIYEAGETSYLDFILSSESLSDLISNYYLVTELASIDKELLETIQKQKQEIETAKKELETSKNELASSKASKESIATQLQASKNEKDSYVSKLSESEKQTQAELEQLQADNDRINKELKAAEQRYQQQLEELRKKQQNSSNGGSGTTTSGSGSGSNYVSGGSGYLQRPVKTGSVTTQMYYSNGSYHGALDFGIPIGTTVYAAAEGVVLSVKSMSTSYGNHIVIQHTNGLRTYYAHGNGVFYVSPGQTVSKGQPIMQSGNSGNSFGAHLHFEVRVSPYNWSYSGNDSRRDPRNYM